MEACKTKLGCLTSRERRILVLVAGGHQHKNIASFLEVSVTTVRRHLNSISQKLGLNSRSTITEFAKSEIDPREFADLNYEYALNSTIGEKFEEYSKKLALRLASKQIFLIRKYLLKRKILRTIDTRISNLEPPELAEKLLYLLPKRMRDATLGDLKEDFPDVYRKFGQKWAIFWYWWQTLRTIVVVISSCAIKLIKFNHRWKAGP